MKTPWNPSRKATARVRDPLPIPDFCNRCQHIVEIRTHREVYGRSYGEWPWIYVCPRCGARVGMHPFTAIPLGTLADEVTREARKGAKVVFETLWRPEGAPMTRSEAYAWLATQLGITLAECHFGMFEVPSCERALLVCMEYRANQPNRKGP